MCTTSGKVVNLRMLSKGASCHPLCQGHKSAPTSSLPSPFPFFLLNGCCLYHTESKRLWWLSYPPLGVSGRFGREFWMPADDILDNNDNGRNVIVTAIAVFLIKDKKRAKQQPTQCHHDRKDDDIDQRWWGGGGIPDDVEEEEEDKEDGSIYIYE